MGSLTASSNTVLVNKVTFTGLGWTYLLEGHHSIHYTLDFESPNRHTFLWVEDGEPSVQLSGPQYEKRPRAQIVQDSWTLGADSEIAFRPLVSISEFVQISCLEFFYLEPPFQDSSHLVLRIS